MHIVTFFEKNPALFLGLSLLLGTAAAFHFHWLLVILILTLCLLRQSKNWAIAALLCFGGAYFSSPIRHPQINLPQEKIAGKGIFHIDQIKVQSSPFHRSLLYKCTLKRFESDEGITYENLPCNIYLPLSGERPLGNADYIISGKLIQKDKYAFVFKPEKKKPWDTLSSSSFNWAEWRFKAKRAVAEHLKKEIADPQSRTFLTALTTGEIEERILSLEFGKIGVQHILAISGFHFALAALFLNFLFRLAFPWKISLILLIASLTLYYVFLGNAPSIQRAYIAICLVACGQLFGMRTSGLNAIGVGLIIELLLDPIVVTQLSFQLTFLCTLAVLLFYPLMHRALEWVMPERRLRDVMSMSMIDKHGYVLSALIRRALSLNLAVHLLSLPVLLHLFHKFSFLSLLYNLFFPFCVSIAMMLLFAALFLTPLFPFLGHLIHALNTHLTSNMLTLTSNPPAILDFAVRSKHISFTFVILFLSISFLVGVVFYERESLEKNVV